MITLFSYPSFFLAKQVLVHLIIYIYIYIYTCILLVVNESFIPSFVDYEFFRYEIFVCNIYQPKSNKNRILPGLGSAAFMQAPNEIDLSVGM